MSRRPAERDYYATLGVDAWADAEELHASFRRRAQELHPDLHPDRPDAEEAMRALNEAWSVLGDPERRARYDRIRAGYEDGAWFDEGADGLVKNDPYAYRFGEGGLEDPTREDDHVWFAPRQVRVPVTALILLVLFLIFMASAYAGPH